MMSECPMSYDVLIDRRQSSRYDPTELDGMG